MSSYAKFLKEILSNKRKLDDNETISLTEECSAIIQNKLPPKHKDPGSFSIPCVIGDMSFERALCDLGASVSLMPLSVCKKLDVEILSNKRKLDDNETISLTEECSAIIQNKLPPKHKDPGSFSIPCVIGDMSFERALCDLGDSVSLMPLSVCKKLDVGELKPTNISLQLANRSIKYQVRILEDVPI
uniref:Uncharacterized protein LOC105852735 n=1 Tax=Cicer arietinum TaxID=3827 RepID=A0A1S3EG49_CICAR|nr:uncharacterized protein LOC105852735 [Cicer arietinum]